MDDLSNSDMLPQLSEDMGQLALPSPEEEGGELLAPEDTQGQEEEGFYENLAEQMEEMHLGRIASELLEGIEEDKSSRAEWEQANEKGLKYLGFKLEEAKEVPFLQACRAFDTTLSTALLRSYSTARAELFPAAGPVTSKIAGESNEALEDQGERVKEWMNYYLTDYDEEYYPDSERLLLYTTMIGCGFRKVYQDPVLKQPVARFIDPQYFIVNNNCVSLLSSSRLTHELRLSKREILLRQLSGFYRDIDLPFLTDSEGDESSLTKTVQQMEGVKPDKKGDKPSLFTFYEVHCDLSLEGMDVFESKDKDVQLPLPYIVTICENTRQILSIRRNWEEGDPDYKRIQYFVQYNYLPGFGLYGIGLASLLGSNSVVLTSLLRQLVDKGTLCNFPGGLRAKGLKLESNDKAIGPSEFLEVDTGGLPLQQAIMPMPYSEPSVVLKELRNEIVQQTQSLASTAETQVAENKADVAVGTILASLEVSNRVISTVLRSFHVSLGRELKLLYNLFGKYLPDTPYPFLVPGKQISIMRQDFNDRIKIIPVSDPVLSTSMQRTLTAQAVMQIAERWPQLHNMKNVIRRTYQSMRVDNIDEILPSDQEAIPLDPITENMNILEGKPVTAAVWQDHPSHILVHTQFSHQNPDKQAEIMAHIFVHRAYDYAIKMQLAMGQQMPSLEELTSPEIQNQIALQAAQVTQQQQMAEAEEIKRQTVDPQQVMMMDIQQREKAAQLKHQEAQLKAETEAFKAQLQFESEKNKQRIAQEMADEKHETDLEIQEMKLQEKHKEYVRQDFGKRSQD